ncbi:hypothetical protein [Leisingera caerulea]|uniref:hypothetical protein n=1 Tax=Leisingera caerulea TaxID=506591 RepID=UPI00047F6E03|nr:hypothetical protein [Leisingera caerulea]
MKIDDSLARGYARQIWDQVLAASEQVCATHSPIRTLRQRKRHCAEALKPYEPILLDKVAGKDFMNLTILCLRTAQRTDCNQRAIGICTDYIDFNTGTNKMFPDRPEGVCREVFSIALISMHAVQRIVQRVGVRTLDDFRGVLGGLPGWVSLANLLHHQGPYMVAVENGVFCCDTVIPAKGREAPGTLVKTFIGIDQMKPMVFKQWQALRRICDLTGPPRVVRRSIDLEPYKLPFLMMADEGRRYEAWKAQRRGDDVSGVLEWDGA